jgi:hypothetical protein
MFPIPVFEAAIGMFSLLYTTASVGPSNLMSIAPAVSILGWGLVGALLPGVPLAGRRVFLVVFVGPGTLVLALWYLAWIRFCGMWTLGPAIVMVIRPMWWVTRSLSAGYKIGLRALAIVVGGLMLACFAGLVAGPG